MDQLNSLYTAWLPRALAPLEISYPLMQLVLVGTPLIAATLGLAAFAAWAAGGSRIAAAAMSAMMVLVGVWSFLTGHWLVLGSIYWAWPILAACLAAAGWAAWRAWRDRVVWRTDMRSLAAVIVGSAVSALIVPPLVGVVAAGVPEDAPVIAAPLPEGGYHLVGGVAHPWLNYHGAPQERFAYDIERIDGFGAAARRLIMRSNADSHSFGTPVLSPCDGRVLAARDGVPDNPPYVYPDSGGFGNFAFIDCGDVVVALAHMREGSVRVAEGDALEAGDPIGEIGNSGFTTSPHLHLQGVLPPDGPNGDPDPEAPYAEWTAVPLRIEGRSLKTNDVLRVR